MPKVHLKNSHCYILIILFIFPSIVLSQTTIDFNVEEGKLSTPPKGFEIINHVSNGNDGFYTIYLDRSKSNNNLLVSNYNKELVKTNTSYQTVNSVYHSFVIDQKLYFIDVSLDKENEKIVYSAYYSGDKGKTFSKKHLLDIDSNCFPVICELLDQKKRNCYNYKNYISLNFSDNKKFISLSVTDPHKSEKLFHVFDSNLNHFYEKHFIPEHNFYGTIEDIVIDNNGIIYLTGVFAIPPNIPFPETKGHYINGKEIDKYLSKMKYEKALVQIQKNSTKETIIGNDDINIKNFKVVLDKKSQTPYCLGVFSSTINSIDKGVFLYQFDQNNILKRKSYFSDFPKQYFQEKYGIQTKKEKKDFTHIKIHQKPNGHFMLIAEKYNKEEKYDSHNSPIVNAEYNNITVAEIRKDGKLNWCRNINKNQKGLTKKDVSLYSFHSIVKDDETYLFLNSKKPKVLEKDNMLLRANSKMKLSPYIIKIDNKGTIYYKNLFSEKGFIGFQIKNSIQNLNYDSKNIIFFGQNNSEKQYLNVILN